MVSNSDVHEEHIRVLSSMSAAGAVPSPDTPTLFIRSLDQWFKKTNKPVEVWNVAGQDFLIYDKTDGTDINNRTTNMYLCKLFAAASAEKDQKRVSQYARMINWDDVGCTAIPNRGANTAALVALRCSIVFMVNETVAAKQGHAHLKIDGKSMKFVKARKDCDPKEERRVICTNLRGRQHFFADNNAQVRVNIDDHLARQFAHGTRVHHSDEELGAWEWLDENGPNFERMILLGVMMITVLPALLAVGFWMYENHDNDKNAVVSLRNWLGLDPIAYAMEWMNSTDLLRALTGVGGVRVNREAPACIYLEQYDLHKMSTRRQVPRLLSFYSQTEDSIYDEYVYDNDHSELDLMQSPMTLFMRDHAYNHRSDAFMGVIY